MARYSFEQIVVADTWVSIATGVDEIAAILPKPGRVIVADTADVTPVDEVNSFSVGADYQINFAVTGLKVWYKPQADGTVRGIRK